MSKRKPPPETLKDRVSRVLGGYGSASRFARGMGLSVEHVGRVLNGSGEAPDGWLAVLELLEALPHEDWPERWKK
jgi:hypothetical protein